MKYPLTERFNNLLISVDIPDALNPKNYYYMKSPRRVVIFVLCLPIILFVLCLTVLQAFALAPSAHEGPVVKIEVTCKYVSLYTTTSDTTETQQRKIFPKGSVLSISGDTYTSEPTAIYITINQTQEVPYTEPIKLIARGRHTVKIRALDKNNNETTLSITYLIVE